MSHIQDEVTKRVGIMYIWTDDVHTAVITQHFGVMLISFYILGGEGTLIVEILSCLRLWSCDQCCFATT